MYARGSAVSDDTATTFIALPSVSLDAIGGARLVVLGAAEASPYKPGEASHSANAPRILREASHAFASSLGQFDFDLDATMFPASGDCRGMVDAGDVATDAADPKGSSARITAAVRQVLAQGAIPIVLGGDDSVPIPVLRAFEDQAPLVILQIDAHVDWGDVIQGNPTGYGSTMRRAAECSWVTGMVQVGIRGLGSGGAWQLEDARRWGSTLVTSYALHRDGVAAALRHIPQGCRCFVSIDVDGLDPSVLPAVAMPTPGGLTYEDVISLLKGVVAKATIAGLALVEYVPERDDPLRLSGITAARIVAVVMGLIIEAQAGQTASEARV